MGESIKVLPYDEQRLPGMDVVVYHDGDEESAVQVEDGWIKLGPTSGDWRVKIGADGGGN